MYKVKNYKKYKEELLLNPYKGMVPENINMIMDFKTTFKNDIIFIDDTKVLHILNKYEKNIGDLKLIILKYAKVGICDIELRYINGHKKLIWFKFN